MFNIISKIKKKRTSQLDVLNSARKKICGFIKEKQKNHLRYEQESEALKKILVLIHKELKKTKRKRKRKRN